MQLLATHCYNYDTNYQSKETNKCNFKFIHYNSYICVVSKQRRQFITTFLFRPQWNRLGQFSVKYAPDLLQIVQFVCSFTAQTSSTDEVTRVMILCGHVRFDICCTELPLSSIHELRIKCPYSFYTQSVQCPLLSLFRLPQNYS
jgi:hypothetical protein